VSGQLRSSLLDSGSWKQTNPGGTADCSRSPLSRADDDLQPIRPDGDGGAKDGLNDGGVEVLSLFGGGADVQLPLEVLGDDGAQEAEGLHSVNGGVTQGVCVCVCGGGGRNEGSF